jgi:acetoin utilization deacetylase AcuC-like enzyme
MAHPPIVTEAPSRVASHAPGLGPDPVGPWETRVVLLIAEDPAFAAHDTGRGHPERAARLDAVHRGLAASGVADAFERLEPREATRSELGRVHDGTYLDELRRLCEAGGGRLDPDTVASPGSWRAAVLAAGAGLAAIEALDAGRGTAAFCALRPPGHHALAGRAMGFCLLNNVAVAAAALAERGERVCIADFDAHHGNGTQDMFWADPRVMYVSMHEWPLYPGSGRLDEVGSGAGAGATVNFPFPAGATGDVYLTALDDVVAPLVEAFDPTWVLVSAGFDAHRDDPLTGLGLTAGDFADLTARLVRFAPGPGRVVAFLEGGYDLDGLRDSVAATVPELVGGPRHRPEAATSGGPGRVVVDAARELRRL